MTTVTVLHVQLPAVNRDRGAPLLPRSPDAGPSLRQGAACAPGGRLAAEASAAGVPLTKLPRGRLPVAAAGPGALLRLLRAVRRLDPAPGRLPEGADGGEDPGGGVQWPEPERRPVVHAHGRAALRACWAAAAAAGASVALVASRDAGEPVSDGWLWRRAEAVAARSEEGREAFVAAGVERRRVAVAGDAAAGVPLARLYWILSERELRRAQAVDWSVA